MGDIRIRLHKFRPGGFHAERISILDVDIGILSFISLYLYIRGGCREGGFLITIFSIAGAVVGRGGSFFFLYLGLLQGERGLYLSISRAGLGGEGPLSLHISITGAAVGREGPLSLYISISEAISGVEVPLSFYISISWELVGKGGGWGA